MIVQTDGICGGRPRIDGTRICCETIAALDRLGWSMEDIRENYPQLTAEQIGAAIRCSELTAEETE